MSEYPNLAGVATENLIEKIGGGGFQASYINWSRTMHLLRAHAPGWLPELVHNADGGILHRAPVGAYLLIRFVHADGRTTPSVPQAIMDNKNNSIPLERVTSRDVTDTQVRGICKAAALLFGLAYELWAKMPLESGYAEQDKPAEVPAKREGQPTSGVWEALDEESKIVLTKVATNCQEYFDMGDVAGLVDYIEDKAFDTDMKAALWTRLNSKLRTAIKKELNYRKGVAA